MTCDSNHSDQYVLLALTSTYPRWRDDYEPSFVHELNRSLSPHFRVITLCPHTLGAARREHMDGVEVIRYKYAPERWESLAGGGGILSNLKRSPWKVLLLPTFILAQAWSIWRLLRERKIDVVQAHWIVPQGLLAALLVRSRRVPFLITSHGADLYALNNWLLKLVKRWTLKQASSVTVVSSAMCSALRELHAKCRSIRVISMGVSLERRFTPDPTISRNFQEILFVGRLVEKKGLQFLLDAMPSILRERPAVFLTVVGFGPDEQLLRQKAAELGLDKHVYFIGGVKGSDLPQLYRRAGVLVAPFVRADSGDQEGLGLVVIEAIGCGCPVVVGNVSSVTDVLGVYSEAVSVDVRSPETLSARILSVLANPEQALALTLSIRSEIARRFDWQQVAAEYAAVLKKIVRLRWPA